MANFDIKDYLERNWIDISSELFRTYVYVTENGVRTEETIESPQWLMVGSMGHRIVDANDVCHYLPNTWQHLFWQVRSGQPHFIF